MTVTTSPMLKKYTTGPMVKKIFLGFLSQMPAFPVHGTPPPPKLGHDHSSYLW
jgi:hypothetical protein